MSNVKLIGVTKPVDADPDFQPYTSEQLIAYCARVSNPANQDNPDAERLLNYCIKHDHWSIFEMVNVVMEIKTTRDIARQILRHRSFSFQEFSQRYANVTVMGKPREARLQDHKNRQNSIEIETDDEYLAVTWEGYQKKMLFEAQRAYDWAIENGIAKEVARSILPEGLTMSRMYMNGTLRSWIHYCQLRMGNGTQKEHREIATQCWNIIVEQFPSLKNVLEAS